VIETTHIILFSRRLQELRLVHDLTNLFLQQTVWHAARAAILRIMMAHQVCGFDRVIVLVGFRLAIRAHQGGIL